MTSSSSQIVTYPSDEVNESGIIESSSSSIVTSSSNEFVEDDYVQELVALCGSVEMHDKLIQSISNFVVITEMESEIALFSQELIEFQENNPQSKLNFDECLNNVHLFSAFSKASTKSSRSIWYLEDYNRARVKKLQYSNSKVDIKNEIL